MSSPYPKLNDRHIDQWKVTELKEELRSRGLKINGLKEELVKRLASSIEEEVGTEKSDTDPDSNDSNLEEGKNDGDESLPNPVENSVLEKAAEKEKVETGLNPDDNLEGKIDEESLPIPVESSADPVNGDEVNVEQPAPSLVGNSAEPVQVDDVNVEQPAPMLVENVAQTAKIVEEHVEYKIDQTEIIAETAKIVEVEERIEDKIDQTENDTIMVDKIEQEHKAVGDTSLESLDVKNDNATESQISADQDMKNDTKNEDSKPSAEDAKLYNSDRTNQVSVEVSPDLGLEIKSESITITTTTSTTSDSVSINEKNELKDNLNANNVNLELEVVKLEMVQPSSSDVVTCTAMDVELCNKIGDVEEGSPEKLNLDRSSGDESMEEDVIENKQRELKNNFEKEEIEKPIDALVSGFSPEKKDLVSEEEIKPIAVTEKRKAEDQEEAKINNEPKRPRRWNMDTSKASESQTPNLTVTTPKDVFQPAFKRSFNRSDSSLSGDATPKERIVPPSLKPATTSLRIDRFLRPFTLKAVQELLAKTGTVSDFWMDQIKTHCFVTYSSVEEATETRNALYNLQWPTYGGRQLIAEFVDPQEVKSRLEAPRQSPAATTPVATAPTALPFQRQPPGPPPPSHKPPHQQLPPPPPGPPPPAAKERLPPPPPLSKKPEPPIMTLDDLFRKTKTTPRIYYLPLSEEQVAVKLAEQGKRVRDV